MLQCLLSISLNYYSVQFTFPPPPTISLWRPLLGSKPPLHITLSVCVHLCIKMTGSWYVNIICMYLCMPDMTISSPMQCLLLPGEFFLRLCEICLHRFWAILLHPSKSRVGRSSWKKEIGKEYKNWTNSNSALTWNYFEIFYGNAEILVNTVKDYFRE